MEVPRRWLHLAGHFVKSIKVVSLRKVTLATLLTPFFPQIHVERVISYSFKKHTCSATGGQGTKL